MIVTSINLGSRAKLEGPGYRGTSGIFKTPQDGAVRVTELGLVGDDIVNTKHHGGPDQAVYLYRQEDYDWWSEQLDRPLHPGLFGENLTVTGMPSPDALIGTTITLPSVTLQLTAPRIPCSQFAARMGDKGFVKQFVNAKRPGFYARVLRTGSLNAGEAGTIEAPSDHDVGIVELYEAAYRTLSVEELKRFLAVPIDVRTRTAFEAQLARKS